MEEIDYLFELIKATIEEEGYVLPNKQYADFYYKAFMMELRSGREVKIQIEW